MLPLIQKGLALFNKCCTNNIITISLNLLKGYVTSTPPIKAVLNKKGDKKIGLIAFYVVFTYSHNIILLFTYEKNEKIKNFFNYFSFYC